MKIKVGVIGWSSHNHPIIDCYRFLAKKETGELYLDSENTTIGNAQELTYDDLLKAKSYDHIVIESTYN